MYQVCFGHEKLVSSCPRKYASNSTREMMRHIQCRFVSSCPRRYASNSIRVHVSNSTDGAYVTCSLQALAQQDAGPWFLSVTQPREPIWLVHYKHMPTHIGPCFLSVTQPSVNSFWVENNALCVWDCYWCKCKYDIPNLVSKALLVMQVKHYISDKKGVASHASKAFIIMQVKHAGESKG